MSDLAIMCSLTTDRCSLELVLPGKASRVSLPSPTAKDLEPHRGNTRRILLSTFRSNPPKAPDSYFTLV
jgi:hypothetical protein